MVLAWGYSHSLVPQSMHHCWIIMYLVTLHVDKHRIADHIVCRSISELLVFSYVISSLADHLEEQTG